MNSTKRTEKTLSIPMLIGVIAVYLTIIQGMTAFLTAGMGFKYGELPTTEILIRAITIPVGVSVVFAAIVISWLGWWNRVMCEKKQLARWAWIIPAMMVLSIIVVTSYSHLATVSPVFVLTLLGSVLLIGIGEELMFRGITLEVMRSVNNTTEIKAALWAAAIFGGAHASNVFTEGSGAFLQAAIVSLTALFFYIALRVSGTLFVPIILHAGWDFSLLSGNLGLSPETSALTFIATLTNILLAVIVIFKWRKIWPSGAAVAPVKE